MPTTVSITQVSSSAIANAPTRFTVTVSNTGAASVSLSDLTIFAERPSSPAVITQPVWLTPQVPVGTGNPSIDAAGSVSYGFSAIFTAPPTPGPSPNAPGPLGITGMVVGQPASVLSILTANCRTSNAETASFSLAVPVLSAVEMFPVPEGGAAVFTQGANANLIAVL